MITVSKLHNLIFDFLLLQGKDLRENTETVLLRLYVPLPALNALMSDFIEVQGDKAPEWKIDEDNQFYTIYPYVNTVIDIREGLDYRLMSIDGTQQVEAEKDELDPVLPNGEPFKDFTKPVYQ